MDNGVMDSNITDAPEYLDQLIVYEIATKNFTSPTGPESGTFASLEEKLPYLEELGINGIWLSGHQLCREGHFYNIWSEYACIRPDRIDPTLGTEEDFRRLVQNAHSRGIRVFLDVITHGVMKDSPLVQEHPDWFAGESWGMKDYDWYGNHPDLDVWWINTWLWYVREFGVDGFRLDVAHYRNDLWAQIRKGAADFGKKILIIAESGPAIRGVTDILQHGEVISHNYGLNRSHRMLYDAAGYCADRQTRANERYQVKIFYEDGTVQDSSRNHWHQPEKVPEVIEEGACTRTEEGAASAAWQVQTGRLRVENIYGEKAVRNIQIADNQGQLWNSNREGVLEVDYTVSVQKKKNGLLLEFPLRIQDGQRLSIQLSCHDGGWVGFPGEENPYCAQGSRYLAGYTTLLAPGVPIFMSGEEFNADYRPLPQLSPGLFGGEPFGKGRWLYGSWIDWEQLKLPEKTQMLEDMKSIIKIRRSYSELIKPCRMGDTKRNFAAIEYEADRELPIPYCYMEKGRVLLIAANPSAEEDVGMRFRLHEVLETAADNTDSAARWQVSALFGELPGGKERILATADELEKLRWTIKRDLACGGGLLVLEFEEIPGTHSPQPR